MSQVIYGQIYLVLAALCCGMALMGGYDLLRLWRWLLPHHGLWIWVEDLLYWSLMAIPVFVVFFRLNDGILRWHGMLGLLVGGILYETGISLPVRQGLGRIRKRIRKRMAGRSHIRRKKLG